MKSLNERKSRKKVLRPSPAYGNFKNETQSPKKKKTRKYDFLQVKGPKQFIRGRERRGMLYSTDRPGNTKKTETRSLTGLSSQQEPVQCTVAIKTRVGLRGR